MPTINQLLKTHWPIVTLLAVSFLLHFWFLAYPSQAVFDEVYFGPYANAYFTHQYYFDLHPPLGKLMLAGAAKLANTNPENAAHIGQAFSTNEYIALRFLPALAGSLLPLVIYLLLLELGAARKTAFLGAFLTTFDNALLTQSKFILMDSFLMLFGFLALYFFLKHRRAAKPKTQWMYFIASIALATFSSSIKWTGLSFLGIIGLVFLIDGALATWPISDTAGDRKITFNPRAAKTVLPKLAVLLVLPCLIYYGIFWIHFSLLGKSGQGDAFMSAEFQQTLLGNSQAQTGSTMSDWQKFTELNQKMYYYQATLKASHPNGSKWYQWPFDRRPVWYWSQNQNGTTANIYLFGNPLIWWAVLASVIFSLAYGLVLKNIRKKFPPMFWILVLGYFANLLPFIFIGRVTFLYHYLPSLLFGILIFSLLYEKVLSPTLVAKLGKHGEQYVYAGFLALVATVFLVLAPLSFGFPIASTSSLNGFYTHFIKFIS